MTLRSQKPRSFFCEDTDSCHTTLGSIIDTLWDRHSNDLRNPMGVAVKLTLPVYMLFDTAHDYSHNTKQLEKLGKRASKLKLRLIKLEWNSEHYEDVLQERTLLMDFPSNTRLARAVLIVSPL